ncbi:MAG: 3'-5' exoribonuclease YhaM family protein [Candidatus Dojkabacteria bacterium]
MKELFVKDLQKNLIITGETFVIYDVEILDDKYGKQYATLTVGDRTGKISGKIWSEKLDMIDKRVLKSGNLIAISGKVDEFKASLQLNISTVEKVESEKMDDYLASSLYDADEMYNEVIGYAEKISRKDLKKVILKILKDKDIEKKYKYWPAAETVHHAFRSGLIQHVLEMLSIMDSMRRFYPNADFDILTAGIILHDIGKTDELSFTGITTDYSKLGQLVGHIVRGSQIFTEFGGKELDEDIYLHVMHLILSHHGKQEYGSPIVPATLEGLILTNIDNLSAKARTADSATVTISDDQDFTGRNFFLEGAKIWKGTMAKIEKDEDTDPMDTTSALDNPSLF